MRRLNNGSQLFQNRVGHMVTAGCLLGIMAGVIGPGAGVEDVLAQTPPASIAAAGRPIDLTKERVLYVVTYSHLDTEWCWTYRHSILDYIPSTLSENFALIDRYPNYVFNWTGAIRYRFMKEYYPDEYKRLKGYIAAGRWVPTGSAWEENDAIVPSPESIIRSVLYSNRFFRREFGKTSNQYMMPDTFGFPASLPTVLAHCGLKGFSTKKLTYGAGSAVGVPFNIGRWIGADGQSVVAALNPGDYRTKVTEDLSQSSSWLQRLDENGKQSGIFADYMYHGAGDLGGSPGPASAEWLEKSLAGSGPIRVQAKGADDFFSAITPSLAARLPSYKGDLLLIQHSAGSINSGAAMKRWNHRNELLATAAERSAVAAHLLQPGSYPGERLTDAWLRFLGGQMHDILPGTSIPAAYEFAWNDQVLALNQFADAATQGVGTVASAMDTQAKGIPLVVFNPLSLVRQDVVEAEIVLPRHSGKESGIRVFGPDGKEVPAQIIRRKADTAKILFLARVPSVGFSTFDVRLAPSAGASPALKVTPRGLENARYRVRLNAAGDVAGIYDKQAKREMLSQPVRLAFLKENPKQHPAWNMDWEDRQKPPVGYVDGPAQITVIEKGPVRVALRVERQARGSRFAEIIRLSAGEAGDQVEFLTNVNWRTKESSLKAVFPFTVANPQATYNWEVGTVQRGNNDPKKYEVPAHQWFDLTDSDKRYGVSVLNEAKYGSDKPNDNTLRLTLLYTPGVRDRFQHQGTQDWGSHTIRYALQGHSRDWRAGKIPGQAARLNQPLFAFQTAAHKGALGRSFSLLHISNPQVSVAAVKKAEDSDEIIVRLFEQNGTSALGVRLTVAAPILSMREVNGQEQAISLTDKAVLRKGALVFRMKAYRPRAFALKLGKLPSRIAPPVNQPLPLSFDTDVTSSGKGQHDGGFDTAGSTIPGDLLPAKIRSGETTFALGSALGETKNAVSCSGQNITLPRGMGTQSRRLYLLAAAQGGDTAASFLIDGKSTTLTIQDWGGYIGQWDTRIWEGTVPDTGSSWPNALAGITPGYIKRDPVAWYADHKRLPDGANDPYRFCYLFRYAIDLPADAKTFTLPKNRNIRILAATISNAAFAQIRPAAPLYDTLAEPADRKIAVN